MAETLSRRNFLARASAIGCSLAASPLLTPVTLAATAGENRLVVIILRGGMDGLDVVRPEGDPDYLSLRGSLAGQDAAALPLDGFFTLHPGLGPLHSMWQEQELAFVHAVSTPYRDKRSHFDGQDVLEAGVAELSGGIPQDGWLNRLLQTMPGTEAQTTYALGSDPMALLRGAAPVSRWTPEADLHLSPQALRLAQMVMADDPLFAQAMASAIDIAGSDGDPVVFEGSPDDMMAQMRVDGKTLRGAGLEDRTARFAAEQLRSDARIAAFSINGWDTHERQARLLPRSLGRLSEVLLTLKNELGSGVWAKTAVVALTEFGRTARINGTGGTDHGTGGAMLLAGGVIRGGRVIADWPGLGEADLYDRRDLMPTRDVRAHLGWLLRDLFGTDANVLEQVVFPGVRLGPTPGLAT